jgi:hypothetical protein
MVQQKVARYVKKDRADNKRLRSIVKHLAELAITDGWSYLVILNTAVNCLRDLKMPFSKNEVYSAFALVPHNEYDISVKHDLLDALLVGAQDRSVFTSK